MRRNLERSVIKSDHRIRNLFRVRPASPSRGDRFLSDEAWLSSKPIDMRLMAAFVGFKDDCHKGKPHPRGSSRRFPVAYMIAGGWRCRIRDQFGVDLRL